MNALYIALPSLTLCIAAALAILGRKNVKLSYNLLTFIIILFFAFFIGTMIGFVVP
jgi:hypothetical protein